jgi:two-component system, sensor histidine kinase and response regulator
VKSTKLFLVILVILLFAIAVTGEYLGAEESEQHFSSIIVVSDDNYPPFIFRDVDRNLQGILVDQWKLWEQKTGIKVELIGMDWAEAQEFIKQGKADVIDTMFITEEREQIYNFTRSYAKIEVPIFFHKNISGINSIKSAKGFSIAVKKGDASIEIFRQNGIVDELVKYNSYEDIIKAASENKIRVFCIDKPPALYFLNRYNLVEEYKYSPALYTGEFHRAVKKGSISILSVIEDGFSKISEEEYSEIDQKWYGKTISTIPGYVKYLGIILGVIVIIFGILLLFSLFLKKQVQKKTSDLFKTNLLLKESEGRYRSLIDDVLDTSTIGTLILDADFKVVWINHALESYFGLHRENVIRQDKQQLIREHIKDIFAAPESFAKRVFATCEDNTYTDNFECHVLPDGEREERWLEHWSQPIQLGLYAGGRIEHYSDITERKLAEEAQKESQHKLINHIEFTPIGVIEFNNNFEITAWNPAAERIFGYSREEAIGYNTLDILVPEYDHESVRQIHLLTEPKSTENINDNRTKDGRIITCQWFNTPIKDKNGVLLGITSMCQDITAKLKAKKKLKASRDILEAAVEERTEKLRIAKEEAELADKAKSDFLSNMSHEIRTPMHQILSYSKFGLDKIDKVKREKLLHYFLKIDTIGRNLLSLLNDLLDLSKLESGKMEYDMKMIHPESIISNTIGEFHSLIDEQGIILEKDIEGSISTINCDEYKIGQVVRNLVSNAIKFTYSGKKVSILVKSSELPINDNKRVPAILVTVSDQGVGIPDDELEHVFDKFIQSSKTKTGAGGTGLGLAICKEIIQAHNGKIWAENNPEGGSTFSFMLPYKQEVK